MVNKQIRWLKTADNEVQLYLVRFVKAHILDI